MAKKSIKTHPSHTATRNACKLCAPLGASMVFKGIAGAMPLLHGSQGCSTYIRRYIIGHFREPIDIASSSFSEETTIFGGKENLQAAIKNIISLYGPSIIGIATTCLAETIGEDINMHLKNMHDLPENTPPIVHVSTPSYQGTHIDGFRRTVCALVNRFAEHNEARKWITFFPGMVSPADLRYLKKISASFNMPYSLLPDYSETLDGGIWDEYQKIPEGGTTIEEIIASGSSCASIEFGASANGELSAGRLLEEKCGVPAYNVPFPLGVEANDRFFEVLEKIAETPVPEEYKRERQTLIDAYVDGHKFVTGKKAAIFGDEDFVVALTRFCTEIGMKITAVVTGASEKILRKALKISLPDTYENIPVLPESDFEDLAESVSTDRPDLMIGSSKGYQLAHKMGIPLIRVGFPVQDRIGSQRLLHIGYEGSLRIYDQIVNTVIEYKQSQSDAGYMTW